VKRKKRARARENQSSRSVEGRKEIPWKLVRCIPDLPRKMPLLSLSLSLSLYLSPWPPSLPFYPFHFSASFCSRVASPQLALLLLPCRAIGKAKPRKIESSSDWPGDLSPISRQNAIIVSLISRNLSSEIFPRKTNG
jgi:hypothetical protein